MAYNRTFALDISWKTLLKDAGLEPERILRRAGLPDDPFLQKTRGLDTDEYIRFWNALEAETNDPAFPVPLIESISADIFDPPLFAALCSSNMMQAVQRLARYKQLIAPMVLETTVDQNGNLTVHRAGFLRRISRCFCRWQSWVSCSSFCGWEAANGLTPYGSAFLRYPQRFRTATFLVSLVLTCNTENSPPSAFPQPMRFGPF